MNEIENYRVLPRVLPVKKKHGISQPIKFKIPQDSCTCPRTRRDILDVYRIIT